MKKIFIILLLLLIPVAAFAEYSYRVIYRDYILELSDWDGDTDRLEVRIVKGYKGITNGSVTVIGSYNVTKFDAAINKLALTINNGLNRPHLLSDEKEELSDELEVLMKCVYDEYGYNTFAMHIRRQQWLLVAFNPKNNHRKVWVLYDN